MQEKISGQILEVPLADIHFDEEFNTRYGNILPIQVRELAANIKESGLIQPVVITRYPEDKQLETGKKYLLVAGYRRYKAHTIIPLPSIKAIVNEELIDPVKARIFNLAENLQRQDLNILEEAQAMASLKAQGFNEFEVAERVGMSRGWVQTRSILMKLPEEIRFEAALGWISDAQIRDLYTLLRQQGESKVFEAVRKAKEARIRGEKIKIVTKKASPFACKKKSPTEVQEMINMLIETFRPSMATQLLAWANGKVSDYEIHCTLRLEAEARELDGYIFPFDGEDLSIESDISVG